MPPTLYDPSVIPEEEKYRDLPLPPAAPAPVEQQEPEDVQMQQEDVQRRMEGIRQFEVRRKQADNRSTGERMQKIQESQQEIVDVDREDARIEKLLEKNPSLIAVDPKYDSETRWRAAVRAGKKRSRVGKQDLPDLAPADIDPAKMELYRRARKEVAGAMESERDWRYTRSKTPFLRDVESGVDLSKMAMAAMRIRDGKAKRDDFLTAAREFGEAEARGDWSTIGKFGDAVVTLLPYMVEIGLTGGFYTGARLAAMKGAREVGEAAAKKMVMETVKQSIEAGVKRGARQKVVSSIKTQARRAAAKNLTKAHLKFAAKGGTRMAVSNPQMIFRSAAEKGLMDVVTSDEFALSLKTRQEITNTVETDTHGREWLGALAYNFPAAFGETAAELVSEQMGGELGALATMGGKKLSTGLTKLLNTSASGRKFLNADATQRGKQIMTGVLGKLAMRGDGTPLQQQIMKGAERMGIHGLVGELAEETVNDLFGMASEVATMGTEATIGIPVGFGRGDLGGGTTGKMIKGLATLDLEKQEEAVAELLFMAGVLAVPTGVKKAGVKLAGIYEHQRSKYREDIRNRAEKFYRTKGNESVVRDLIDTFTTSHRITRRGDSKKGEIGWVGAAKRSVGGVLPNYSGRQRNAFAEELQTLQQIEGNANQDVVRSIEGRVPFTAELLAEARMEPPATFSLVGDTYFPIVSQGELAELPEGTTLTARMQVEEGAEEEAVEHSGELQTAVNEAGVPQPVLAVEAEDGAVSQIPLNDPRLEILLDPTHAENVAEEHEQIERDEADDVELEDQERQDEEASDEAARKEAEPVNRKTQANQEIRVAVKGKKGSNKVASKNPDKFTEEDTTLELSLEVPDEPDALYFDNRDVRHTTRVVDGRRYHIYDLVDGTVKGEWEPTKDHAKRVLQDKINVAQAPPVEVVETTEVVEEPTPVTVTPEPQGPATTADINRLENPTVGGTLTDEAKMGIKDKIENIKKAMTILPMSRTERAESRNKLSMLRRQLREGATEDDTRLEGDAIVYDLATRIGTNGEKPDTFTEEEKRVYEAYTNRINEMAEEIGSEKEPSLAPTPKKPSDTIGRPISEELIERLVEILPFSNDDIVVEEPEDGSTASVKIMLDGKRFIRLEYLSDIEPNRDEILRQAPAGTTEDEVDKLIRAGGALGQWQVTTDDANINNGLGILRIRQKIEDQISTAKGEKGNPLLDDTVWHELVHAARSLGLWSEPEWGSLVQKYASDRVRYTDDVQIEEAVARGVGSTLASRNRLWSKIQNFLRKIVSAMLPKGSEEPPAELAEKLLTNRDFWRRPGEGVRSTGAGARYSVKFQGRTKEGFYSKMARVLEENLKPTTEKAEKGAFLDGYNGDPRQLVKKMSKEGAPMNEIKWSDITTFLEENPKATRAQVLDYVDANHPRVVDVVLGDTADIEDVTERVEEVMNQNVSVYEREAEPEEWERVYGDMEDWEEGATVTVAEADDLLGEEELFTDDIAAWESINEMMSDAVSNMDRDEMFSYLRQNSMEAELEEGEEARWEESPNYTLPDGEEYRELLIKMPIATDTPNVAVPDEIREKYEGELDALEGDAREARKVAADKDDTWMKKNEALNSAFRRQQGIDVDAEGFYQEGAATTAAREASDRAKEEWEVAKSESRTADEKVAALKARMQRVAARVSGVRVQKPFHEEVHFSDHENVLMFVRFNIRKVGEVDKEKWLFIEEMQSDWHAGAGRARRGEALRIANKNEISFEEAMDQVPKDWGYRSPVLELMGRIEKLEEQRSRAAQNESEMKGIEEPVRQAEAEKFQVRKESLEDEIIELQEEVRRREDLMQGEHYAEGVPDPETGDLVPDAPYKGKWQMLGLKRMILHAVEQGDISHIAWTTGKQQNYRNDVSRVVKSAGSNTYITPSPDSGGAMAHYQLGQLELQEKYDLHRVVWLEQRDEGRDIELFVDSKGFIRGGNLPKERQTEFNHKHLDKAVGEKLARKLLDPKSDAQEKKHKAVARLKLAEEIMGPGGSLKGKFTLAAANLRDEIRELDEVTSESIVRIEDVGKLDLGKKVFINLYDRKLVNEANEFFKKNQFDIRVEGTPDRVPEDEFAEVNQWHFPITQTLRDTVAEHGLPYSVRLPGERRRTTTENFKRWFGDSKVVGDDGEPLEVYHGTYDPDGDFESLEPSERRSLVYFATAPKDSKIYGSDIYSTYLKIERPRFLYSKDAIGADLYEDISNSAEKPYDGTISYHEVSDFEGGREEAEATGRHIDSKGRVWFELAVENPTQIKSSTENVGTFDPTDPRIRHSIRLPSGSFGQRRPAESTLPIGDRDDDPDAMNLQKLTERIEALFPDIQIGVERERRTKRRMTPLYTAHLNLIMKERGFENGASTNLHNIGEAFAANTGVWNPGGMGDDINSKEVKRELNELSWDPANEQGGPAEFFRHLIMGDAPIPGEKETRRVVQEKKDAAAAQLSALESEWDAIGQGTPRTKEDIARLNEVGPQIEKLKEVIRELDGITSSAQIPRQYISDVTARAPEAYKHFYEWLNRPENREHKNSVEKAQAEMLQFRQQTAQALAAAERNPMGATTREGKATWREWISWNFWEPYMEVLYRLHQDKDYFPTYMEKVIRRTGIKLNLPDRPILSDMHRFHYGMAPQRAGMAIESGVFDPLPGEDDLRLYGIDDINDHSVRSSVGGQGLPAALNELDFDDVDKDLAGLWDYMLAQHTNDMTEKRPGYYTTMTPQTTNTILSEMELPKNKETKERYDRMATRVRAYAANLLRLKAKYGAINEYELDAILKVHKFYYPLIRKPKGKNHKIYDTYVSGVTRNTPGSYSFYRSATGSDAPHVDPVTALLIKTQDVYKAVAQHSTSRTMFEMYHSDFNPALRIDAMGRDMIPAGIREFFHEEKAVAKSDRGELLRRLETSVDEGVLDELEMSEMVNATVIKDAVDGVVVKQIEALRVQLAGEKKGTPEFNKILLEMQVLSKARHTKRSLKKLSPEEISQIIASDDMVKSIKELMVLYRKVQVVAPIGPDLTLVWGLMHEVGVENAHDRLAMLAPSALKSRRELKGGTLLPYRQVIDGVRYEAMIDPRLIQAIHSEPLVVSNHFYRAVAMLTHYRKAGAVYLNPSFGVMDWFRNTIQYAMGSRYRNPHNAMGAAIWWSTAMLGHRWKSKTGQPHNEVLDMFYRDAGTISGFYGELTRDHVKLNNTVNEIILHDKDDLVGFDKVIGRLKRMGVSPNPLNALKALQQRSLDPVMNKEAWFATFDDLKSLVTASDAAARAAEYYAVLHKHGFEMKKMGDSWKLGKVVNGKWTQQQPNKEIRAEAANASKEAVLNFLKQGEWGQHINKVSMFWAAAVNASDKAQRIHVETLAATKLPGSGFARLLTDKRRNPMHLLEFYGAGMGLAAVYWALVHDEDWYLELPDHVKNMYWVVPMPNEDGGYFYIAKGYDAAHTFNSIESALNSLGTEDKDALEESIWHTLDNNFHITPAHLASPDRMAGRLFDTLSSLTGIGPTVEVVSDFDFFRGKSIEGPLLRGRQKAHRVKPHTLQVSRVLGKITGHEATGRMGLSPVMLEHMANQWSGGMYKRYVKWVDIVNTDRKASLRDVPGMHQLYRPEAQYSRSLEQFFEKDTKRVSEAYHSARDEYIPMTSKIRDDYNHNRRFKGIISDLYKLMEDEPNPKERLELAGKYVVGMARQATGEVELEKFPTIWRGAVSPGIEAIREDALSTLVRNASNGPLKKREAGISATEFHERKSKRIADIRAAVTFLKKTGLRRTEIERYMKEAKRGSTTYRSRFRKNWSRYGG